MKPTGKTAAGLAVLAITAAPWAGLVAPAGSVVGWLADLASHFRSPLFALAFGGLVVTCLWPLLAAGGSSAGDDGHRRLRAAVPSLLIWIAAAGINAAALAPYQVSPPGAGTPALAADGTTPTDRPTLRVVTLNVEFRNRATDRVVGYLRDARADVVVLVEIDDVWAASLGTLGEAYPFRHVVPGRTYEGVAILSRWPLHDVEVVDFGSPGMPSLVATVAAADGDVTVIATHPRPPLTPALDAALRLHLRAVGRRAADRRGPCLVMGDLNATPWSAAFGGLVAESGLRDSALGRGIQPTWHARLPVLRIPIDHVLVSSDVDVLERRVGPAVGSDHMPVEATLAFPPAGSR